jgi:uncharacterized protein (TIGR04255 family)
LGQDLSTLSSNELPNYKSPPVEEVVCGVLFDPIKRFLVPHFGLLWEKYRAEYPHCRHVDPLMPIIESSTGSRPEEIISEVPLPRIWFLHDDGKIIQVQRDRFLHNWRKLNSADEYPHYQAVYEMFSSHFLKFQEFLNEYQLGKVIPLQYEMTYVNSIPESDGWETLGDTYKIFRDFSWGSTKERFLPNPVAINWQTSFDLPGGSGRLHFNVQSAVRIADKRRVFRLEITARGIVPDTSHKNMNDWFNLAHEWIVRGFADFTNLQIQKDIWGRIQ